LIAAGILRTGWPFVHMITLTFEFNILNIYILR
jgi:hypothetical protein